MTAKKVLSIAAVLVLAMAVIWGCADFTRNAYRTLAVSQATYDGTLTTLGSLYKEGKMTEEDKAKAVELGRLYKNAHNDAVSALEAYVLAPKETEVEAKDAYIAAASKASVTLANLIAYLRSKKEGK